MRLRLLLSLFTLACLLALGVAQAQEAQDPNDEEEGARGAFLKSRETKSVVPTAGNAGGSSGVGGFGAPKTVQPTPRPRTTPKPTPKPTPKAQREITVKSTGSGNKPKNPATTPPGSNNGAGQTANVKPPSNNEGGASIVKVKLDPSSVGLGYSLFQRGAGDEPVRVDPSNSFRTGDSVRIWLEPSADGYLYIFNTTNNGKASFIYPDMRLNKGNNKVRAHYPFELPSADTPDPRFRWFSFYGQSGTENLYILLTREPLKGLPATPEALGSYCAQNTVNGTCIVEDALWAQIKSFDQQDKVLVAKNTTELGQKQSKAERPSETASRDFGLVPTEPAPTVVFMNASADRGVLFAKLELKHN